MRIRKGAYAQQVAVIAVFSEMLGGIQTSEEVTYGKLRQMVQDGFTRYR